MRLLAWVMALVLASAAPTSAGPVAAAVAAVFAGITVKAVALFALRLFAGVGLSILQQRRARRGRNKAFGLQVTATTRGELESETTITGSYATKGHLIYHNSHGPNNKYYQTVIELGGLPGATFSRVMVDGVYSELGEEAHPDYGFPLIAKRDLGRDYAWIKVYDGTQTAADPTLVANYAEDPETPWTEAHIGRGIPYAILTMEVSSKVWPNGAPEQRYEARGIPFYDLRRDSTAGGTGPHRWDDPTTWEPTRNPVVQIYNILRGIDLYDGSVWGGEAEAEDLPGWNWVPGMNACDVDLGDRRKYEAGYEIKFAEDTPGEVIDELLAACNGQIAEFGGFFYIQVDAPDIPVASITDDDLLVTDAATKDPFPELLEIFNRVTAKYVSPGALWNGVPLEQISNPAWQAEDGIVRNFEMDLPAVFNAAQGGQLAKSALEDHRRWRRHAWPLPPDYAGLRPLNTVSVTSAWNDYADKLFEVTEIVLDLHRLTVVASLRERDPGDFEIDAALEIPDRSSILPRPVPNDAGLPFFNAAARTVTNAEGTRAHAAVDVTWDASGIAETIKGIAIECQKRETEEEVWSGTVLDVERGLATIQPVPLLTNLRVRAKALSDNRRGTWSAWIWVTSDDVRVAAADLSDTLRDQFDAAFALTQARLGEDGIPPSVADLFGRIEQVIAPIGPGDVPELPHVARLDGALVAEAQARAGDMLGVAGGVRAARGRIKSAAQLALDATARDFLARDAVRTALVAEVEGARAEAASALTVVADGQAQIAQAVQTLETTTADISALAQTIDQARIDGDEGLANQIALLSVGTVTQFDHAAIWHWDTEPEGWTGVTTAPSVTADGWLAPASGSGAISPIGLGIAAQTYRQIRARLRRAGAPTWAAQVWWAASGQAFEAARRVDVIEPEWADDVALLTVDLAWSGTVDRVRIDLPAGVEIDWLAIGRPAPGASSAEVAAERAARIAQVLALAEDITALGADLTDLEGLATGTAEALTATTARVTATETGITTLTDATTALGGEITDLETGLTQTGEAVDTLTVRTDELEGGERVQSNATRAVRSRVKLSGAQSAEGAARALLDGISAREVVAQAAQDLNTRIDLTEEQIQIVSAAVTLVQAAIPGLATANALDLLTAEVTEIDGALTALASRTTTVESALNTPDTGLLARVSTVEATKVTEAEAVAAVNQTVSANYGDLTALAEATAFAEATADGIAAGFVMRLNEQNVFEAISVSGGTDGPIVTGRWSGDYLRLDGNVEVTGDFLATKIFAEEAVVGRLVVVEEIIGLDAVGKISNTRRATNTGGLGTSYSTVLTHVASHKDRTTERNMILFCRMQIEGSSAAAGNILEYRILRNGVLMSGVPPLKRDVRPGEVAQEFVGIKQRTTANEVFTIYTLEARVATNGAGIAAVTINTGTEIWTEEKAIAGFV
ncbi:hypothetical protein ACLGGT_13685 [Roseovarius sp. MS2]|uniref:hypothetical protein n=1 Tax=Roseovarius sp. MS2 TaxID=3390728 RepID=UPI003EDC817A